MAGLFRQLADRLGWSRQVRRAFERRFDATSGRRLSRDAHFGPVSTETLAASGSIRSRTRYYVNNNPWAASGVNVLKTAISGVGIVAASQHPDAATRKAVGSAFAAWAREADADGLTDFYGIQAAAVEAMVVDGEAFIHLPLSDDGLRLRLLPAEMVDASDTRELGDGRRVVGGIEFDARCRRVAYHVSPSRPTDIHSNYAPPVRIPAADIIHLYRPIGAGQVRGVSWFAPVLLRLAEADQLEDALLVNTKIQAMLMGFLVDQNGNASANLFDGTHTGSILESGLEPGTLKILPAGYDVKFSTPAQALASIEFAQLQLRAIAAGLGVPEHLLTGDLRNANYSSTRAALIGFRQRVEAIQFHTLVPQMLRPIYERAVTTLVLSGDLSAPDFESRTADWLSAEWYPPATPWVDPLKDQQAEVLAVSNGFKSRRQVVAAQGYAVEDLDNEIAADRAREKQLGLTFGTPKAPAQEEARESASA